MKTIFGFEEQFVRRSVSQFLVIAVLATLNAGCCSFKSWRYGETVDKLEVVTIIGIGETPYCVIPGRQKASMVNPGESYSLWLKVVFYDAVQEAVEGRKVRLTVVDALGEPSALATLSEYNIITNRNGFSTTSINIIANDIGVFRIRADYDDKLSRSTSYSSPIISMKATSNI